MKPNKKTLLRQMYDGEFNPSEAILPHDPEYNATIEKTLAETAYLSELLDKEGKAHLKKLDDLIIRLACMSDFANFAYGFRAGMLMMQELLSQTQD